VTRRRRWARCGEVFCAGGEQTSGGGTAAAAAGRPRLGGCATVTSGGDVQGLSLRVETVSTLFPVCSLKKRRECSNTRNGRHRRRQGVERGRLGELARAWQEGDLQAAPVAPA
jgi:hypothetical protein